MSNSDDKSTIEDDWQQNQPNHNRQPPPVVKANNWYAKLHPFGKSSQPTQAKQMNSQPLNLSLFFRIWLAVAIIIIISGTVVFIQLFDYVRPVTQQVLEDTLVDTAKLLAINLEQPMATGEIYDANYQASLDKAFADPALPTARSYNSRYINYQELDTLSTWYQQKTHSSFRVYITDATGKVIYDSLTDANNAEAENYYKWNDVYLTLNGQYGARTTRKDPEDSATSMMYVAQPIKNNNGHIIGVVSVGKPMATILPYLDATRQRMLTTCLFISLLALLLAGLVAWWLQQSMQLVTRYTQSLAEDEKKPYFYLGRELNELTDTIENMKHRLENRAYVTDYVHTLTHELKSPLTAIRACGELLEDEGLDSDDRLMLSQTISEQSLKLQHLIDRLLLLAKIEQPTFKLNIEKIDLIALLQTLIAHNESKSLNHNIPITLHNDYPSVEDNQSPLYILADKFWLAQALQNILDNALYFAHSSVVIDIENMSDFDMTNKPQKQVIISIFNDGDTIPEYALSKVFERYFSLSHQHIPAHSSLPSGKKGTGLGMTLVKQVIERHTGSVSIANIDNNNIDITTDGNCDNSLQKYSTATGSGVLVTVRLPSL
ncbi:two-component system sensor histidine kinase CreC [Psychrobacter sp. I-STPA10]|uniref:two-component system sensor histidine kinase CreC n=1 Tax=Psychrobacter sp. I-STPA10 TaxID=2585769 RepID=UPI001E564573|nr:two-component system sensor histidine kinase CreC [Psychrobacter sp. I-STPA10]